jgi:aryl-alcohol dehydrogenase-like predicted oxidoreductase
MLQVRSGKALYVGISDTPAWKIAQCNTLASLRGWTPFAGVSTQYSLVEVSAARAHQHPQPALPLTHLIAHSFVRAFAFSPFQRTAERDLLPMCADLGVGCLPWGVLSQGLLSGKYKHLSVTDGQEAFAKLHRLNGREEQRAIVGIDSYRPKAVLREWTERNAEIAHTVGATAAACGRTPTQVS